MKNATLNHAIFKVKKNVVMKRKVISPTLSIGFACLSTLWAIAEPLIAADPKTIFSRPIVSTLKRIMLRYLTKFLL